MFNRQKPTDVEVQITPMLDMAFQILAFFIMTYNPMPLEGQFAMNLLPTQAQVELQAPSESDEPPDPEIPASVRTLATTLIAAPSGMLSRAIIGDDREVGTMEDLRSMLRSILADESQPFDQAEIYADPSLKYSELIRVVDTFMSLGISKISFGEADLYGEPRL